MTVAGVQIPPSPPSKRHTLSGMPFVFDETDLDPRDGSVAGCKPERVRWTMKRGLAGAAVGKIEEKRKPEDFSGHRKRGAKHFKSPLLRQRSTMVLTRNRRALVFIENLIMI